MKTTNIKRSAFLLSVFAVMVSIQSCGPKCKQCHTEVLGMKTPATELCGDQLKQAEKTQGMICN